MVLPTGTSARHHFAPRRSETCTQDGSRTRTFPGAVSAADLAKNDQTSLERLAATEMIASVDDPRSTVDGMLDLGEWPQGLLPRGLHQVSLRRQNVGVSNVYCEGINFAARDGSVDLRSGRA